MSSVFKSLLVFLLLFLGICTRQVFSQANPAFQLRGSVYGVDSNTGLYGASIYVDPLGIGSLTDEKGNYEVSLPKGNYKIIYSYVGYENKMLEISLTDDLVLDVKLTPSISSIDEIVVTSNKGDRNISNTETGHVTLKMEEMEKLPFLMGEVDPIRILQFMPGVQTSGEGSTGFYVRGGAVDQNLMLLDNSIVYNPSHLFGFFSVFNGGAIKSIDLYKGGIPASFGGRLSSITQVNTREGDMKNFKAEGGVGVIAANLLVEGPIKKNKGSFLVSGRRTYFDLYAQRLRELDVLKQDINYYFYDLNINANYRISDDDQISIKTYGGKDDFSYGKKSLFTNTIIWGNKTASLNWRHFFSDNLWSEASLTTTTYDMNFGAEINTYVFKILSQIRDKGFNYQVNYKKGKHNFVSGLTYTFHILRPNNINASSDEVEINFSERVTLYADEAAFFINDKFELSEKLEVSAGVRLSGYSHLGPFRRYNTDENLQVIDTISYTSSKRISPYVNAEPRLAIRYSLDKNSSVKASYDKNYQYLHMAPLSSVSLPTDIWVPSSSKIKPQSSDQISLGYFRNFNANAVEGSIVLYYKKMNNQIEYRDGVIVGYSKGSNFDDNFVFGEGLSYGSEFLLKKNTGKLNGIISYTLSKTTRKFAELNQGKSFAAKYDRLHDFSMMLNYNLNSKWTFSGVWVYGTGNALNLPIARYIIQENVVNEYGPRNSFRMPAYHRMDLAVTYTIRKSSRFESYWNFSAYNVYNRKNPYYIYFETKGNLVEYELKTSLKQVSLFPIIPSIAYRFKF